MKNSLFQAIVVDVTILLCSVATLRTAKAQNVAAAQILSAAIRQTQARDAEGAEAYLLQAIEFLRREEIDNTISAATEAIRLDPHNSRAFHLRSLARQFQGDLEGAFSDGAEAIRLDPTNPMHFYFRGSLWLDRGNMDLAIKDYGEAIRLNPDMVEFYRSRGSLWKSRGEFSRAIQDLEEAITRAPNFADAYDNLAYLLATCSDAQYRDGKRALELATKACELANWKSAVYLDSLAASYAETGNFQEAIKWQTQAIELKPETEDFWWPLGHYRVSQPLRAQNEWSVEDHQQAVAHYKQLAEQKRSEFLDDLAKSRLDLGHAYANLGEFRLAVIEFEESIDTYYQLVESEGRSELCQDLAIAHGSLGYPRKELGQTEAAIRCSDAAIEILSRLKEDGCRFDEKHLAGSYANRGIFRSDIGESKDAIQDFNRAQSIYKKLVTKESRIALADQLNRVHFSRVELMRELDAADIESLAKRHRDRGVELETKGRPRTAILECEGAIDMYSSLIANGDYWEYFLELGDMLELRANIYRQWGIDASVRVYFQTLGDFNEVLSRSVRDASPWHFVVIQPKGEFAEIDVTATNEMLQRLVSSGQLGREQAIDEVTAAPEDFAPPALFATALAMSKVGRTEEGFFWYCLGLLRLQ